MSEHAPEQTPKSANKASESTQPESASCCSRGSCCTPHGALIVALIALLLGAYAAYTASRGQDNSAIEARITQLEQQVAGMNEQIATLNEQVKSNRENMIQTRLKKALQNIQEIGDLAGEGTKAAIHEVENILKTLTSIGEKLVEPDAAPAGPPQAADGQATQPEPAAAEQTTTEPTVAEPAATPTESSTPVDTQTDNAAPATTESAPSESAPADATPSAAPAPSSPAPSDATPADAGNAAGQPETAAEPSAPQAF